MRSGNFWAGLGLTFFIAGIAYFVARVPYLEIVGQLVIAIMLGLVWNGTIGVKQPFPRCPSVGGFPAWATGRSAAWATGVEL